MGRAVTKNSQGELEVTETFNFSGANPTISSVKLIAKDGGSVSTENPDWLGFTQSTSGSDLNVTLQLDVTGLETYTTYTFEIAGTDDAGNEATRRVNVGIGSLATAFELKNIMGEEDVGRSTNGTRVLNGGTARVVVTTTMDADIEVEIADNPDNVDSPTFTETKQNISQDKRYHEFFFGVPPDSLIAFRVTAKASFDQSVPDRTSSVYYITTGNEINSTPQVFEVPSVSIAVYGVDHSIISEANYSTLASSITIENTSITSLEELGTTQSISSYTTPTQVGTKDATEGRIETIVSFT